MKILYFSEMRPAPLGRPARDGWAGGYSAITEGVGRELAAAGHTVKVLGLSYDGREHDLPFDLIPHVDYSLTAIQLRDIIEGWWPDLFVAAVDIPHHGGLLQALQLPRAVKYCAITPVDGAPILPIWADGLAQADQIFSLSQFGVNAFKQAGLKADLLPLAAPLGIGRADMEVLTAMQTQAELADRFVVVKNADNTARKNWPHTLEFFARWAPADATLYAITRPDNPNGWDLPLLLERYGGKRQAGTTAWRWQSGAEVRLVSDLGRNELAWIYNFARPGPGRKGGCLLMDTGAEGLGMPTLEAFQVGVPVIALNHTANADLLANGRGLLIDPGYKYVDIFGNTDRFYPEYSSWATALNVVYEARGHLSSVAKAREWINQHTWAAAAQAILETR